MKTNEIRKTFLDFFKDRGHIVVPSDSLVPSNDPTLLFTSAGMVQFKPLFEAKGPLRSGSGQALPYTRAASCQKCFRTPDLDRVGHTARHHTFFEMLGNFSFGDYGKKDAIGMGLELVTGRFGFRKEDLWITVYDQDDESAEIWRQSMGIAQDRIIRRGKEDNFWGPVNPDGGVCGPCTEFYVDRGEKFSCGKPSCAFGCDCDRYLEFYNIVFPGLHQDKEGKQIKLERPGVDTGLGLERLASILQGVHSNFDIDSLLPLKHQAQSLCAQGANEVACRVITDHARASAFLIADGVLPSNEGRGYVLRRVIRRAVRRARQAGAKGLVMPKMVEGVSRVMAEAYPELHQRSVFLQQVVQVEEERFIQTLDQGVGRLNELMEQTKSEKKISGEEAFKLYDTFGFPLDLTEDVVQDAGYTVDRTGFERCLKDQQERARKAWKGSGQKAVSNVLVSLKEQFGQTGFLGYQSFKTQSAVLAVLKDGLPVSSLGAKETGEVILAETPFYGESGGQAGDIGILAWSDGMAEVLDTQRPLPDFIVHKVKLFYGTLKEEQEVQSFVDVYFRMASARHHTATHVLQAGLRNILGAHVTQAGSSVTPKRLRFDFTHMSPMTEKELYALEEFLNEAGRGGLPVSSAYMSFPEAKKLGALAFFGEKYGEVVRVISIGEFSKELCGGTHVPNTAELGMLKVLHEGGLASGVRRIEAVAGHAAYQWGREHERIVRDLAEKMKASSHELPQVIDKLMKTVRKLEDELKVFQAQGVAQTGARLSAQIKIISGVKCLVAKVEQMELEGLKSLGDELKSRLGSGVVVLGSSADGRVHLVGMVTPDVADRVKAGEIVKTAAAVMGGSGGGKPQMAQGGGKDPTKLEAALLEAERFIKKALGE